MVGIKDVAERAGVAVSTVSYVISGKRSVSPETRSAVLHAMRDLDYVPNRAARALRSHWGGSTHILALSAPAHGDTDYTNWSAFFLSVAKRSRHHGYEVLLLMDNDQVDDLTRLSDSGLVDGILLLDVDADDIRVDAARNLMVPMVSIGVPKDVSNVYAIDLDFERIGRDAVTTAYRMGHRHLLHIGGVPEVYERGSNFMIRLRESIHRAAQYLGITLTFMPANGADLKSSQQLIDEAFEKDPEISVIIGQPNMVYLNNIQVALERRGLTIPNDISMMAVATFGNASALMTPLDEIPMRPSATCARAVDMMIEVLSGKTLSPGVVELLESKVIRRGSMRNLGTA